MRNAEGLMSQPVSLKGKVVAVYLMVIIFLTSSQYSYHQKKKKKQISSQTLPANNLETLTEINGPTSYLYTTLNGTVFKKNELLK